MKNGFRRAAAAACLIAFCFGPAKLLPLVLAFSADAEGSHAVGIESSAGSGTKLVLRHQGRQPQGANFSAPDQDPTSDQDHGLASQVICLLSGTQNAQADHVVLFATGGAVDNSPKKPRMQSRSLVSKSVRHATNGMNSDAPFLLRALRFDGFTVQQQTSPTHASALRCLRSTCLLI